MFKRIFYFFLIAISVSIFSMIDWNGLSSFDPVSNAYATGGGGGGGHHDDDDDDDGGDRVCPRGEKCVCHNANTQNPQTLCFDHGIPSGHKNHVKQGKDTCGPCICEPGECTATTGVTNLFNDTFPNTACKDATVDASTFRDGVTGINFLTQVGGLTDLLTLQFTANVDYQGEAFTSNVSVSLFPSTVPAGTALFLTAPIGGTCAGSMTDGSFTFDPGNIVVLLDPVTCMSTTATTDTPVLIGVVSSGSPDFAAGFTAYVDPGAVIDTAILDFTTPSMNTLVAALLTLTNTTDIGTLLDADPIDAQAILIALGAVRIQLLAKQLLFTANQLFTNILCGLDTYSFTGAISTDVGTEGCVTDIVDLNSTTLIDTCLPLIDFGGV